MESSVAIAVSLGSERLEDDRCLGRLVRRILDPDASADTGERGLASPCCLKVHIGAVRYQVTQRDQVVFAWWDSLVVLYTDPDTGTSVGADVGGAAWFLVEELRELVEFEVWLVQ